MKMEKFQLRTARHGSGRHRFRHGTDLRKNREDFPELAPDSVSRSSDTAEEDTFKREFGCRYSKEVVGGAPMKKLLADEMSRESESKRRPPNVIARLMGLDGLPQPPSHKQQKKCSENSIQRVAPIEKARRSSPSYSRRSSRRSSKEEQEFKDVFEFFDAPRNESSGHFQHDIGHSKLTEAEMTFIQQKFTDAKRLSTDEKLHNSKEFHDAIEDLDSNKDLLLKFLQQPDSLFTKHAHDLQLPLPQFRHGHSCSPALKSPHSPQCESNRLGSKIEIDLPCKNRRKPYDGPFGHSSGKAVVHNPLKSSKVQVEGQKDSTLLPTRIVVLKPNLGKVQNAIRTVSSPPPSHDFLSDCRKHMGLPSFKSSEAEVRGKKLVPDDAGPSRYKSRESREIAKEITRQMRNTLTSGSMNYSTSKVRGYAGDESSSSRSESESVNDSEEITVASRNSIKRFDRYRPSSSCSTESSVSREAKKRLSERWKMTHKSVDMGVVSRGSTLADMLAIPDREVRQEKSDALVGTEVFSDNLYGSDGPGGWVEPLGISSRDGWKDGCIRNLSRSRSVPASSSQISSPRTGMRIENLHNDRYIMPKEVVPQERSKAAKGAYSQREGSSSKTSKSRSKKPIAPRYAYSDFSDTSPEIHFGQHRVQSIIEENPIQKNHAILGTSASEATDASSDKSMADVATEHVAVLSQASDREFSACMKVKNDSSSDLQLISQEQSNELPEKDLGCIQRPIAELQSPASSKEADQPSPVSVLEASFPDDLSSGSECFESLSADLHGLRMQLRLLKLESEAYAEGSMLISSDEDVEPGSVRTSQEKRTMEESKECSYTVDVLLDSAIDDTDLDTFMATWHSPECPVSPQVFEELEKKYSNESWQRSERRLLFDRINLALLVIYEQFVCPQPWVRPALKLAPKWTKNRLEDGLWKVLASQDKKNDMETTAEKVLVNESEWLDLGNDIDVIGREIEKLLTDEMVIELVTM